MRWLGFLLIMLVTTLPALGEDWDTADGKTYRDVKVIIQEDDGVRVTYTGGVGKIPYYELSLELRKRFGEDYETLEAKRIAAEKALAEAIRNSASSEELKKLQDAVVAARAKALAAASTQPDTQTSVQPGAQPGVQTTAQPGAQPNAQPGVQTTAQPDTQPSAQPGAQTSAQPGAQPNAQPGAQTSAQPGAQPNTQADTNTQSVQSSASPSAPQVTAANPYPGSIFDYNESLDVCTLESPAVDVFLVLPDAAPAAPNSPGQGKLTLKITTDGRKPEAPAQVDATFLSVGAVKMPAGNHHIKFLVDGTYFPVNETENQDGDLASGNGQGAESISFHLTPEQTRSILNGKNVNFSIGSNNYRIDEAGISIFRKFFADIDRLPPASTNFVRVYHKFINQLPSIITLISTVCEYIILGGFAILVFATIAAIVMGMSRLTKL